MLKGFRDFILRGNVVDLAVGVVIGAAFNSVVESFVKSILTPLIGVVANVSEFASFSITIHGSKFLLGAFINSFISFVLVAAAVYFFVVVPMNKILSKVVKPAVPGTKDCPECMSVIPIEAKRCSHCGQVVA